MTWEPANDVERALSLAVETDDRRGYFQLVAVADLFLPQVRGERGPQRFLTVRSYEQTFLPVFTSWQALAAQCGDAVDGYTITNYAELARKWPDTDWRLALNPGTPIDAYLAVEAVRAAAVGDVDVPTLPEMIEAARQDEETDRRLRARHAAAEYPDDPAAALLVAAEGADAYGYVDQLLRAVVLVPTGRPVAAESILDDGFPWRPAGDAIEVFTTPEALRRTHPDPIPVIEAAMPFVLAMWPAGYGLSVNPGGDDALTLAADEVVWLLSFGGEPDV